LGEEEKKRVATLQESQNVNDIPQLVDNKIGPVKITNLSKINGYDRRAYRILASRFGLSPLGNFYVFLF
jgi:hypothetical protein